MFPWLARYFLASYKQMETCASFIRTVVAKEVESHKERRKPDENPDFIHYYLDEIDQVSISELFFLSANKEHSVLL